MAGGTFEADKTSVGAPHGAAPSRIVATAGHVDHGKSTLVEWLTGSNPDRLEEERRRGLTIDLGFASTVLESGIEVGMVDVPGHVRFLKNMVAGVGAVDACLLVVSAVEGWKPQSEDHLRILDLLGVRHGIVALTHAALVDGSRIRAVTRQVAERVAGTFLEGARTIAVDAPAGIGTEGPDGLRAALDAMVRAMPPSPDSGRPRLWIDRSFAMRGAGTVVTGSLAGGTIRAGEHMEIASAGTAAPVPVRVRGLESYGHRVEEAEPGRRLAVNLTGVDHRAAARGMALLHARQWHRCTVADATLRTAPGLGHAVSGRGSYLAHMGTAEQAVRIRVLGDREDISPGETGMVRLRLTEALPLAPGDRFLLRDAGRRQVVGAGTLLDVAPVRPAAKAAPSVSVERVVAERGWVEAAELERLTGRPIAPTLGRWVVDPEVLRQVAEGVRARVLAAGAAGLDLSLLDERERAVADSRLSLRVSHGIAFPTHVEPAREPARESEPGPNGAPGPASAAQERSADGGTPHRSEPQKPGPPDADPPDSALERHPYLAALRAEPFSPPPPDGVDRNDLRRLVRSGLVVDANGVWFAASALEEAVSRIGLLLDEAPDGVRVSDVRDALGTSRRYVLALLAHFDVSGVTRRRGDLRIGGPMLSRSAEHEEAQT